MTQGSRSKPPTRTRPAFENHERHWTISRRALEDLHDATKPDEIIVSDARTYLRSTRETFDVITSDPIHPWVRGGGDLYTVEYFESCKSRLAPGGVERPKNDVSYQLSTSAVCFEV